MKSLLLLFVAFGITFIARSQDKPYLKLMEKYKPAEKRNYSVIQIQPPQFQPSTSKPVPIPGAKLLQTLPNGNQVYALSQDNMPCIVPDMSQFNMPRVTLQKDFNKGPGTIPNPAM